MRRLEKIVTFFILFALSIIVSCKQNQKTKINLNSIDNSSTFSTSKDSITKNGNVTTTISTNFERLEKLLDFKNYTPTKVKFKYIFIDNADQNQRLSSPGPSDYSLQAILYFDSTTFKKILDYDKFAEYPSPNFIKNEFKFDWLDNEILTELNNSKENYHGHPDFFFGTINGKSWYLNEKILITKISN